MTFVQLQPIIIKFGFLKKRVITPSIKISASGRYVGLQITDSIKGLFGNVLSSHVCMYNQAIPLKKSNRYRETAPYLVKDDSIGDHIEIHLVDYEHPDRNCSYMDKYTYWLNKKKLSSVRDSNR